MNDNLFVFVPDDRPARVIRFVERGALPSDNLVAVYDHDLNLVLIDREHYETLSKAQQEEVLRTQDAYIELEHLATLELFPLAAE